MDDATWERLFEHYKPLGDDGIVEVGVYVKVGDARVPSP